MNIPFKPELNGKVAVVTGGAGVLCREFAKALALCGAKVAILNRTLSKAEKVVEEDKEFISIFYGADITEKEAGNALSIFEKHCPDAEVSVLNGGQPVYYYLISAE